MRDIKGFDPDQAPRSFMTLGRRFYLCSSRKRCILVTAFIYAATTMDHNATILMSPARALFPTHKEVLDLAENLFAQGDATAARKLLEDALVILDPTPDLITAAAFFTMRDPTLPIHQRLRQVFELSTASSEEMPQWMLRVRLAALLYVAEESQLIEDWEAAYSHSLLDIGADVPATLLLDYYYISHSLIAAYKRKPSCEPWLDRRVDEIRRQNERHLDHLRNIAGGPASATNVIDPISLILVFAHLVDWNRAGAALVECKTRLSKQEAAELLIRLLCGLAAPDERHINASRGFLRSVAALLSPEDPDEYIRRVQEALTVPKMGLALSGGGFRAAFFHLGTLAALAEHDILRHVSVISTVSGGSVVGTLYYLELRKLLSEKPDSRINRDDYIRLVQRTISSFSEAAKKNIRMRAFGDYRHALTGIFKARFNRTQRTGELYDRFLFEPLFQKGRRPSVSDLGFIHEGVPVRDFDRFNRLRTAKLPELVINTTSLRDGDSFSFAAHWAGQRAGSARIDEANFVSSIPLGLAVAASSSVPGLFDPVSIGRITSESLLRRLF